MTATLLTPDDILGREEYESARDELRRSILVQKNRRRVAVGDHCTVHFECRDTMRYQVHEMLRAEGTWDSPTAVGDELEAYNPLIPGDGRLSATLMLEYETPEERALVLPKFVHIDRHVWLQVGETEPVLAEFDAGQISPDKVSSVQYVKWPLDDERRRLLKQDGTVVRLRIDHPVYSAEAVLGEETRKAIMHDPD